MSDTVVRLDRLGKRYRVAPVRRATTLREAISGSVEAFRRRLTSGSQRDEAFWALRDVSFDVGRGEVLGIIGRNGAGKSTLLRILSRITDPTEGSAWIRGRVGSLLEVGTGFHPELTGRENIVLNGAVLGMKRREISSRLDEIVAFAEVERFIDTPVKHYSSGMYLRLAFAVAAHLEPEVLIVDEVLAVGDAAFQKKCLGKMGDVARQGRTVLFVSHNMAAVRALCSSGVVLVDGRVAVAGPIGTCITHYAGNDARGGSQRWSRPADMLHRDLTVESVDVELHGSQPRLRLLLDLVLTTRRRHKPAFVAIDIRDVTGTPVMQALPEVNGFLRDDRPRHEVRLEIELFGLIPGRYSASVWVGSHNTESLDWVEEAVAFEVTDSPAPGRSFPHTPDHGYVVPLSRILRNELSSRP